MNIYYSYMIFFPISYPSFNLILSSTRLYLLTYDALFYETDICTMASWIAVIWFVCCGYLTWYFVCNEVQCSCNNHILLLSSLCFTIGYPCAFSGSSLFLVAINYCIFVLHRIYRSNCVFALQQSHVLFTILYFGV